MDGDPGEGIFRAMLEVNGMPKVGKSATTLAMRNGKDIVVDHAGLVHRPPFRPLEKNGLSCSRTIGALPLFALPIDWGGSNDKTVVWMIAEDDLGVELVAGDDPVPGANRHVSIGPSGTMPFDEYGRAILATHTKWKKVVKN
jgi:hypothetical protein